MKRLATLAAGAAITFGSLAGVAAADSAIPNGCDISNTGADSNNVCVMETENTLTFTCKNDLDVVINNDQNTGSGSVTLTGNTNSGFAYSGDASNQNNTVLVTDISCAAAPVTPAPVTPEKGGKGAEKQAAKPVVKAAVLPVTGVNPLATTGIVALALATLAGLSRVGSKAYKAFRS